MVRIRGPIRSHMAIVASRFAEGRAADYFGIGNFVIRDGGDEDIGKKGTEEG
jgi:hypothetical protein